MQDILGPRGVPDRLFDRRSFPYMNTNDSPGSRRSSSELGYCEREGVLDGPAWRRLRSRVSRFGSGSRYLRQLVPPAWHQKPPFDSTRSRRNRRFGAYESMPFGGEDWRFVSRGAHKTVLSGKRSVRGGPSPLPRRPSYCLSLSNTPDHGNYHVFRGGAIPASGVSVILSGQNQRSTSTLNDDA